MTKQNRIEILEGIILDAMKALRAIQLEGRAIETARAEAAVDQRLERPAPGKRKGPRK